MQSRSKSPGKKKKRSNSLASDTDSDLAFATDRSQSTSAFARGSNQPPPTVADFKKNMAQDKAFQEIVGRRLQTTTNDVLQRLGKSDLNLPSWRWKSTINNNADTILNSILDRYGRENQPLAMMNVLKQAGLLDDSWKGILTDIDETYNLMPASLKKQENLSKVVNQLIGENRDMPNILEAYNANFNDENFQTKAFNLSEFLRKLDRNVNQDIQNRLGPFAGIDANLQNISLTGSDPHNRGESVAIIETDQGKFVYKPRVLSADSGINGRQDSIFTLLNQILPDGFKMATMDYSNQRDYGYQQFAEHAQSLSQDQAQRYYRQMGVLTVIAKAIGLADLHQDNVRVGPGGDVMITDAEVVLKPRLIMDDSYRGSEINMGLLNTDINGQQTPNTFKVIGEQGGDLQRLVENRLKTDTIFRRAFQEGVEEAMKALRTSPKLVNDIISRVDRMRDIRVVPLATEKFEGALQAYNRVDEDTKNLIINDLAEELLNNLPSDYWQHEGDARESLRSNLKVNFQFGDIPRLTLNPATSELSLRGSKIATLKDWRGRVQENINRISNDLPETVTRQVLGDIQA